jgi:hypothetical protein
MSGLETRAARNVVIVATATKLARICSAVKALDDIAKDHVTHSDRRADDSGQKKVQTADDR